MGFALCSEETGVYKVVEVHIRVSDGETTEELFKFISLSD